MICVVAIATAFTLHGKGVFKANTMISKSKQEQVVFATLEEYTPLPEVSSSSSVAMDMGGQHVTLINETIWQEVHSKSIKCTPPLFVKRRTLTVILNQIPS